MSLVFIRGNQSFCGLSDLTKFTQLLVSGGGYLWHPVKVPQATARSFRTVDFSLTPSLLHSYYFYNWCLNGLPTGVHTETHLSFAPAYELSFVLYYVTSFVFLVYPDYSEQA